MTRSGADNTVKTTCPYCGVGCGVLASREQDETVMIAGDPDHPANFGKLCSKGAALGETTGLEGRLLYPQIAGVRAKWEEALDLVAHKFTSAISDYGRDSVAFYVSGQLLTEDYYVANKLMKGFIGTANIDTNSRLCMASSVAGHRRAFGSDTVPGTYEDLELADLIVLVGSNLAWCHPVLYQRIAAAKAARPKMKIVLVDPRRTTTSSLADMHLPITPDGDVALFDGLLTFLEAHNGLNQEYIRSHTTGFEEALEAARSYSMAEIAVETGLEIAALETFYKLFLETEKTVTLYSQGVNQSSVGTDKVNAIINCHLATGRIGREGMGPFSITGQPNAMGGREVGGLANMLACHMDIENPDHRSTVQRFWNSPVIADKPGLKAVDMFRNIKEGSIKAVWIMGTNPAVSMPESDLVKEALDACPFVVVSDIMQATDTTLHADVKLPSAAWGEKEGLVTNSERRMSRQRKFLPRPGEVRADWWQIAEVAKRMGFGDAFDYSDTIAITQEFAALSAFENDGSRDFDIGMLADMTAEEFAEFRPIQWPVKVGSASGSSRFFADGGFFTPDRKARFQISAVSASAPTDPLQSFTINTGRIRDHWHTMTRTGKSPRLSQHFTEPFVEIHPADADELGIQGSDLVEVYNDLGSVIVRSLPTKRVPRKSLFLPMHWTDQFASNARINSLVPSVTDPVSGQPAAKKFLGKIRPFTAAYFGFAVTRDRPSRFTSDYWAQAKCVGGWRTELAVQNPKSDSFEAWMKLLGEGDLIDFQDQKRGEHRVAVFDGDWLAGVLYMSRKPIHVSRNWVAGQLDVPHRKKVCRNEILLGRPSAGREDVGAIVCSCFSVGRNQIVGAIKDEACYTVTEIGNTLSAGTNCGSCRSEIQDILDELTLLEAAE